MGVINSIRNLPKKMKAIVNHGPREFSLELVDVPEINPEEVLLQVGGCGICAGDVKTFIGIPRIWGDNTHPAGITVPVIPGHEFYGKAVSIGKYASEKLNMSLGDWMVSEPIIPCGKCRFCLRGEFWMCEVHNIYGFRRGIADGAFAEYIKLPSNSRNHILPKGFPLKSAPYVEPLACGIHAVDRAKIGFDDVVVIAGIGSLGIGMLQTAKLKKPRLLIAIDIKSQRLKLAKKYGADIIIDPLNEDPVSKVKDLTNDYGCDIYIQASGHPQGVIQGLDMLRRLGRFVEFSLYNEPTLVDWSIIGDGKELEILGSHSSPFTFPTAIRFLHEGLVGTRDVITHEFPLEEYKKAMSLAEKGDESVKVVFVPNKKRGTISL
jgi:threonine dehydrogenase-like Zn-dependent dehydrogenase